MWLKFDERESELPMTPTISYVLYNLADGRDDVTAALPAIRDALDEQCNGHYSEHHGGFYVIRNGGTNPNDRQPNEVAINIRHTIPVDGALAYHTVSNGVEDIEVALDLVNGLTDNVESLSVAISHEVLETNGDPGANGYKMRDDGQTADAEEMCDWVQNTGYQATNGVWVSNFLLKAAFIPGMVGPWDYMTVMKSQYDISHGYGIQVDIVGNRVIQGHTVRKVGVMSALQENRKRHAYSRARRRGLFTERAYGAKPYQSPEVKRIEAPDGRVKSWAEQKLAQKGIIK